jgi:hypothetical protein
MGGFDGAALAQAIALPEGHVIHAVIAIGRHGDLESLPEALRSREAPNGRLPLSDLARHGSF